MVEVAHRRLLQRDTIVMPPAALVSLVPAYKTPFLSTLARSVTLIPPRVPTLILPMRIGVRTIGSAVLR